MTSNLTAKFFIFVISTSLFLAAAAFGQGPGAKLPGTGDLWIDSDKSEPAGTHYKLFATPSRGPNTQGSYLVLLPSDYETSKTRRYPVLYWLHGGAGNQRQGAWMVEKVDGEIRAGKIPPFIMVLVHATPDVRYINSKDGTRPVENVIIKDLIPHVDATYRTIADRKGRAIEGFSMGGYGALHLGYKYPDLFGAVSGLAPSITDMKDEPSFVTEPFGNDQAFYDEMDPRLFVKKNAKAIRGCITLRLLVGDRDKLLSLVTEHHELLTSLKIEHQFAIVPGAEHRYEQIIEKLPFDALTFWKDVFGKLKY